MRLELLLLLALAAPARALKTELLTPAGATPGTAGAAPIEVVSGEAIVRFEASVTAAERKARLSAVGAKYAQEVASTGWTLVELPPALPVSQGLALLGTVPGVEAAAPNHFYRAVGRVPNDPLFNSQYALANVAADAAWEYETGTSNRVTIAVGDTGIDITHTDLAAKFANTDNVYCDPGADKNADDPNPACTTVPATADTDACGHGTAVAGVAAAATDNGNAVAGMSWNAQLVSFKLFRDIDCVAGCSAAGCGTDDWSIANALDYARVNYHDQPAYGKVVVNLSVGGNQACPVVVQNAVTAAVAAGMVVVAASGNQPFCGANINSPAVCNGVIPVGATTSANTMASYSCAGNALATNGVSAPGDALVTTANGGGTATASGTSFATPMVAGLAALIYSHSPLKTPAQIQADIRAGAESIGAPANSQGAGRINAYRSLRLADKGTLAGFDGEQKPIAFPNPFKPSERGLVTFGIPPGLQGAGLKISVYTLDGQLVREVSGLSWNGKNKEGNRVASGTYVFVVSSSAGTARGRVAVLN